MKEKTSVFEINEEINEIKLNEEKISNIDEIFKNIIGNSSQFSHITIDAKIQSEDSIVREYLSNKDDFLINNFADKLLDAEKVMDGSKRKKSITTGYLFIKQESNKLSLLKLEKTSVADTNTFKLVDQLGTEKNYYKACIIKNKDSIQVIDKSRRVANYWIRDFLGLEEIRNNTIDTSDLIDLLENKELFSDEIKQHPTFKEIFQATRDYIFDNNRFEKDELIQVLNNNNLTDIDTSVPNFSENFYSQQSSVLNFSFDIDPKVLKDKYKAEIQISEDTFIKTNNFENLVRRNGITFDGSFIQLQVDVDFQEEVKTKIGIIE
ncbi:hypothetical protein [Streptococcus zalophi]|uniref:Nucleoid-associated protein n=1 Tax=Streptococcus zalophi TaxID=640031 RepID=A0A934PBA0_9STRE|nr:hypothetical protein [Streptococcus zalophi]MBJ8350196.1 hypothetical protein [Streptococcus zalophi]